MLVMIVTAVATLICRIFVLGFSEFFFLKKSFSVIIKDEWTEDRKCLIMTDILCHNRTAIKWERCNCQKQEELEACQVHKVEAGLSAGC